MTEVAQVDRGNRLAKRCVIALLGAAAAALLAAGLDERTAQALPAATGEPGGNIVVAAAQFSQDAYGLMLVDTRNSTICAYQWLPDFKQQTIKLKLVAARNYTYDMQLDEYNTELPPREVKKLVEQHRRLGEATTAPIQGGPAKE